VDIIRLNKTCIYRAFLSREPERSLLLGFRTRHCTTCATSQRAELVIKSAKIKPTHLEGGYDWSIVLSFDITLSLSYYSWPPSHSNRN